MSHDLDAYIFYDAGSGANVLEDASAGFGVGWRSAASRWLSDGPIRGELSDFAISTGSHPSARAARMNRRPVPVVLLSTNSRCCGMLRKQGFP